MWPTDRWHIPFIALFFLSLNAALAGADVLQVLDSSGFPVKDTIVINPRLSASKTQVTVDQIDKRFVPFVSAVTTGATVAFPNSDDIRHHVYSFSDAKTFELRLYHANDAEPVLFDRPGLVTLGCNVHDTMKAYILVTDQVASVTGADGQATIQSNGGPLLVWHPQFQEALELQPVDGKLTLPMVVEAIDEQASRKGESLEARFKRFRRQ